MPKYLNWHINLDMWVKKRDILFILKYCSQILKIYEEIEAMTGIQNLLNKFFDMNFSILTNFSFVEFIGSISIN